MPPRPWGPASWTSIRSRWGSSISDLWFDNRRGEFVVAASDSADQPAIAEVFARRNLGDRYRVAHVEYSADDLATTAADLNKTLQRPIADGSVQVRTGFGRILVTTVRSASDEDHRLAAEAAESARAAQSVPVIERESETRFEMTPSITCNFPYCDTPMGSIAYGQPLFGYGCTLATPALINGVVVILTAGHCVITGYSYTSKAGPSFPETVIGTGVRIVYGNASDSDWGWVQLRPGLPRPWFGWQTWGSGGYGGGLNTPTFAYKTTPVPAGSFVCKEGSVSETTCGTVFGMVGAYVLVSGYTGFACQGDSGGVWRQNPSYVVGIHAAIDGPYIIKPTPNGNVICKTYAYAYATPIDDPYQWAAASGFSFYLLNEIPPTYVVP